MPSNPSAIQVAKEATMSHAPLQARFDVSNMTAVLHYPGVVPFSTAADNTDPLTGFLKQSDRRPKQTEAERAGADRFGMSWPMLRAIRLHSGDRDSRDAMLRRIYSNERNGGACFVPLEVPINPAYLYRDKK